MAESLLRELGGIFDALESRWQGLRARRLLGTALVVSFVGALAVIEANRQGWLPPPLGPLLPTNHFAAVDLAFTLVLLIEVLGLVWALVRSVANSVGKQFELLALIFLRKAFLEFATFGEPIEWARISGAVLHMLADAAGALLIFVALGFYYRVQRHYPITTDDEEEASFVAGKKVVALLLLAAFVGMGGLSLWERATGGDPFPFFEAFYTVLIFSDILLVLLSFRYSSSFRVVFRNSGFAAATVMMRLALTAPPYVNVLLGVGAVLFALGLSLAYNAFSPVFQEWSAGGGPRPERRARPPLGPLFGEAGEADPPPGGRPG